MVWYELPEPAVIYVSIYIYIYECVCVFSDLLGDDSGCSISTSGGS